MKGGGDCLLFFSFVIFRNLLFPQMDPIVECGIWAATSREHKHSFEDAHQDSTIKETCLA